jgi:hypothetical protein
VPQYQLVEVVGALLLQEEQMVVLHQDKEAEQAKDLLQVEMQIHKEEAVVGVPQELGDQAGELQQEVVLDKVQPLVKVEMLQLLVVVGVVAVLQSVVDKQVVQEVEPEVVRQLVLMLLLLVVVVEEVLQQ